jgi:hypothetical protein
MSDNSTALVIASDFPLVYVGLIFGVIIIFLAAYLRSPILWVGALVCFIGVYFEPDLFDTYYQVAVGIVMIFCLLMATFHYKAKRYGG